MSMTVVDVVVDVVVASAVADVVVEGRKPIATIDAILQRPSIHPLYFERTLPHHHDSIEWWY